MDNSKIDEIESGAASFLTGNDSLAALVDKMLLDVYTAEDEETNLFLEGCDDEQIYQQLEVLHNNKILEEAENEEFEIFEPSDNEDEAEDAEENVSEDGEEVTEENDDRETEENEGDGESEDEEGIEGFEDIEEDRIRRYRIRKTGFEDEDFDEDEAEEKLSKQASKIYGKTEIDDKFFSLREMEEICDEQEKNEEVDLDEEMLDELYGDGGGDRKDLFGKYDVHRYQGVEVRQEVYRWH